MVGFPRVDCAKCEDYSRDVAKSGGYSRDLAKCGVSRFSRSTVAKCEVSRKDFAKRVLPRSEVAKCEGDSRTFALSTRDLARCRVPTLFQKGSCKV